MIAALLVALTVSICLNVVVLVFSAMRLDKAGEEQRADHAKCIAHVTEYVGNEFAARVLESAGSFYDSPEGERYLNLLASEKYTAGGPNVPVLFMRERAHEIRQGINP